MLILYVGSGKHRTDLPAIKIRLFHCRCVLKVARETLKNKTVSFGFGADSTHRSPSLPQSFSSYEHTHHLKY